MKVILLTDVPKVGNKYDVKDFKEGYAQNVLLSKGLAEIATPQALARLSARRAQIDKKKEEEMSAFNELISSVNNKVIKLKLKSNEKGHLFKAVSPRDVVDAIKTSSGVEVDPNTLIMEHIKELGSYSVIIKKGDKKGKCEIVVE
jgi:large subunit ribosomal protein L9